MAERLKINRHERLLELKVLFFFFFDGAVEGLRDAESDAGRKAHLGLEVCGQQVRERDGGSALLLHRI